MKTIINAFKILLAFCFNFKNRNNKIEKLAVFNDVKKSVTVLQTILIVSNSFFVAFIFSFTEVEVMVTEFVMSFSESRVVLGLFTVMTVAVLTAIFTGVILFTAALIMILIDKKKKSK